MKIAIVGTGISGLGAAYWLSKRHDVVVYEKNDYVGGHSRTIDIPDSEESIAVDTGFIVFNYPNYPLLTRLFESLDVPIEKSNMSFAASISEGWLEYGSQALFAQKRNLFRPRFWRMVSDILRFNRHALHYMDADLNVTLGQCMDELKMG